MEPPVTSRALSITQIITFFFEYLATEKLAADHASLSFVGGAMTYLLSQLAGQVISIKVRADPFSFTKLLR